MTLNTQVKARFSEIVHLQKGWDGHQAEPIKQEVVERAVCILKMMDHSASELTIVPSSSGEINLEWYFKDVAIEVLVPEHGPVKGYRLLGLDTADTSQEHSEDITLIAQWFQDRYMDTLIDEILHGEPAPDNQSGFVPVEYKVVILPEYTEEVSKGGIVLATETLEKEKLSQVKGKLIAIGGSAFNDWMGRKPRIGESVYFAKYAGYVLKGIDDKEYRLTNDKDITAIIESN